MVQVTCTCFYCIEGFEHPERHAVYHEISGLLTVPESLDPRDVIHREACITCGHVRAREKSDI